MTQEALLHIVQSQLAIDMNCTIDDLNGEKDSILFTQARENPGRRPFPRGERHFEMLSMGRAIIVSASPDILAIVQPALAGKSRDEAFSMPFVYGHGICYLPDLSRIEALPAPAGFSYELIEQAEIPRLYHLEGFKNAIGNSGNHPRPDVLAAAATQDNRIVGMAGACIDCAHMWQIGIDVFPEYRNHGLAAYLVNQLMLEILKRGRIPYYCAAIANISSQRVAHRAGFLPAWVCSYKGNFEGYELLPTC
jgi:RimJ/RimL family protein N-acetyltransferase